jgi:DNA polymerase-3 subunit delta
LADPIQITLLHGSDEFAISAAIDKLCAGLGDAATAGMNITRFDGRAGLDAEALNTAVNAMPFLAPRRVMVLIHPGAAFSSPEARKKFLELLEKAPDTTTLVLAEYPELKKDHWLVKWAAGLGPRAAIHPLSLPKRWEMPRWIEGEAKRQGGQISQDAAARLSEMVGEDTRIAALELTKLLTYVNFEREVNMADVETVSLVSAQGSVFDLVDALGQGDGRKAQHTLHQLLENEEAFELWGMVIRQFRLLLQARELLDEHADAATVQRALGLHEFVAQKVTNQARRFSMPALESIYHKLLQIDADAKTSRVPLDLALDTLVVGLAQRG